MNSNQKQLMCCILIVLLALLNVGRSEISGYTAAIFLLIVSVMLIFKYRDVKSAQ